MLASVSRKVSERRVSLPIDGEIAAPETATAVGSEKSRPRRGLPPALPSHDGQQRSRNACSNSEVFIAPTSGPPIVLALKVKLVTRRPGGVAAGSDTFAAAQMISDGHWSSAVSERATSSSYFRSTATPRLSCSISAFFRSSPSASGGTRFRANAEQRRRL